MSRYFDKFPKMLYTTNGSTKLVTNLLTRVEVIQSILNNASLYYQYDIQEGDTPEIVADKFYNDSQLHWVVMMFNQVYDPFYDWPMTYQQFLGYIKDKYGSIENSQLTTHHFEKIVSSTDNISNLTTTNTYILNVNTQFRVLGHIATRSLLASDYTGNAGDAFIVDDEGHIYSWDGYDWGVELNYNNYNVIVPGTETRTFYKDGNKLPYTVTVTIDKSIISCFDYENRLNESKRKIKLVRPDIIPTIRKQFENLMSA